MKAVILVGGLGTRLRPFTFSIPKPLLPVGERPILQIIIEQLRQSHITDIILATGYHAELIRAFCGDGSKFGVDISYVHEDKPLGTAGPLSLIRNRLNEDELILVMNGDIITKVDFCSLLAFSSHQPFDLTVGYTKHVHRLPFGVLTIEDAGVKGILEKPSLEYCISAGIYVVRGGALRFMPDNVFFTMPEFVSELISAGRSVGAYYIKEFWLGLETIDHFDEAIRELNNAARELTEVSKG